MIKHQNEWQQSNKIKSEVYISSEYLPDEHTCAIRILQIRRQETDSELFLLEFGIRYQNIAYGW